MGQRIEEPMHNARKIEVGTPCEVVLNVLEGRGARQNVREVVMVAGMER